MATVDLAAAPRHPSGARGPAARRTLRLAAAAALGGGLAAVQWLPALVHLAGTARAGGLAAGDAGQWSARPVRLVELAFPWLWGDPMRFGEGLYFGFRLHDRDLPYLASLYPGLLVTVLGAAALLFLPVPRRAALALMALAGAALGLGRFTPLHPLVLALPGFGQVRYPEKFLVLTGVALAFAAALGWQRLLDGTAGRRGRWVPAVAIVLLLPALAWLAATHLAPAATAQWLAGQAPAGLPAAALARGAGFLRGESRLAVALLLAVGALTAVAARGGGSLDPGRRRRLAAAAVALLAADLWIHGRHLVRTMPAAELATPPPLARAVDCRDRLWFDDRLEERALIATGGDAPELASVRAQLAALEPYSGNLWGCAYVLGSDFDLTLSRWGRWAAARFAAAERAGSGAAVAGAWNAGTLVAPRPTGERLAELAAGRPSPPVAVAANPRRLPRYRGAAEVVFHPTARQAAAALAGDGFDVARRDHWIGPPRDGTPESSSPPSPSSAGAARVAAVREAGARIAIDLAPSAAPAPRALVAAVTFHPGWRAAADGRRVALHPTALGQVGLLVPADARRVELVFRDPWVAAGAAVSAATLALLAVLLARRRPGRRRRDRHPDPRHPDPGSPELGSPDPRHPVP